MVLNNNAWDRIMVRLRYRIKYIRWSGSNRNGVFEEEKKWKKENPDVDEESRLFYGKRNENSHNRGFLLITGQNEYFVFYEMTVMTERVLKIEFC